MYRVMIVDDEYYIRKSFRNRIDWPAYQMEVVGEAANGEEAYRMVAECRPDVMFVDIRMPILDGFDLTALLVDEYPDIYVIIISAYNDFQYAKTAIEKGVFDYLLKPLEEEEVGQTLTRLLARMEEHKNSVGILNLYHLNWQEAAGEKEEFCCIAIPQHSADLREGDFPFQDGSVSPWPADHRQIRVLRTWLAAQGRLLRVMGHEMPLCQVFGLCGQELNRDEIKQAMLLGLSGGHASFDREIVIGISEVSRSHDRAGRDEVCQLIAEAVEAVKGKLFAAEEQVFLWYGKTEPEQQESPYHNEKLAIAKQALSKKDYCGTGQALTAYVNSFQWDAIGNVITLETIIGIVLDLLFKAGWDAGMISEVRVQTNELRRPNYLLMFDCGEAIRVCLCGKIKVLTEEFQAADGSDLVQRMTQYIEENYSRTLPMEELEKQFFMSQSSLLLAFKKKKNMTIGNYIEAVRMEKAKELLKSGLCTVQQTAEAVGYLDANYFCKVFKRYAGETPSKYRMKG